MTAARERLAGSVPEPTPGAAELLTRAVERLPLSGRGRARVARVARSAAALAGSESVLPEHVAEALGYRSPREFRKQLAEKATENAVDAVRRSHDDTAATEAVGSRPEPPEAVARSASLDASAAVDHP